MKLKTRRVYFAGCTPNPNEAWMKQIARNLTDTEDGFLNGKRYLIMDRDAKFCEAFREILKDEDVKPLRLPPRSPKWNANLERYFRSLKDECLSRMIFFGESSVCRATESFIRHYHEERTHQGPRRAESSNLVMKSDRTLGKSSAANGLAGYCDTTTAALHPCKDDERSPPGGTPTTRNAHHPRPVWLRPSLEATTLADQPVPCPKPGRDSANSPCQSLSCQTA